MPKIDTSNLCFNAVASCAAYMSPLDSPAESRSEIVLMREGSQSIVCRQRCGECRSHGTVCVHGHGQFLLLVLELIEPVVDATLGQQFLVRALFAQTSLVKHENAVGMLNRAQA